MRGVAGEGRRTALQRDVVIEIRPRAVATRTNSFYSQARPLTFHEIARTPSSTKQEADRDSFIDNLA
jgi:hypothetical protein